MKGRGQTGGEENHVAKARGYANFLTVELSYFLFSFFVHSGLWTELTAIQFRGEAGTILMRPPKGSPHLG